MIPTPPHHSPSAPRRSGVLLVVWRLVLGLLLGGVVGLIGTVGHRMAWWDLPLGLALALALTLSAAVLCRAWAGVGTLLACGAGWLVTVQLLAAEGPGGDVLVPADTVGYVWTYGGLLLFAVAAFLPRRWFVDDADAG
ncbi:DUF6113 family protein [Isoptericola sp. AK164]|uniref:DUF6113 family protein n=1 Tax=Isoptericola sp. AK164 TaxID=3024246 RepID=UPI00241882DF|nr:DUF6113 family protein [Isoptericola sp. AK164]